MLLKIPWNMFMPHDNTTWRINLAVNVTLHDVVKRSVVKSTGFFTSGTWLEKDFHATETFGAINVDVSVWKLVGLILVGTFRGRFELRFVVKRNVAQVLFDITTDLPLERSRPAKSKRRMA